MQHARRSSVGTMRLYASISNIIPLRRSMFEPIFTDCFSCLVEIGAFPAMTEAVSKVSANSDSALQSRLTMPQSRASFAENGRPVSIISFARLAPTALRQILRSAAPRA